MSQLYKYWQKSEYGWRTYWYSVLGLLATSLIAAGLLASVGWAVLWDCWGCGGNVNFGLRDLAGMIVFRDIFYIGLLHNQGRKDLWGRSGRFDWIHKIGHWLFFWGSLIGGIGFWRFFFILFICQLLSFYLDIDVMIKSYIM